MSEQDIEMVKTDVGVETDVESAIKNVKEKYGRIDVIINNAGIDIFGRIEEYRASSWDNMLATNLTSAFLLSRFSITSLKESPNPVIINISSRLGIKEYAEPEFIVYGTVKAALNFFTIGLATELSDTNIRVNAVIPTPTKTDLFDEVFTPDDEQALKAKGKLGTPQEVAELVLNVIEDKTKNGELIFDKRVNL
jgi:3-oxoacyl-[acyl-carrier protein] reductase